MKRLLFFVSLLASQLVFSQEDTLRFLELDETVVSYKKEIAYGDREYFITDFHVGDRGRFVLMKRFSKYRLYLLDENMQPISQLDIDSKGRRLKLYEDCLGFLHLMAPDSLHQLEVLNEKELVIWESNSISLYYRYFKNCVASNEQGMITKKKLNFSQTTAYYQQVESQTSRKRIYAVEDSMELKSLEKQFIDLPNAAMYEASHLSEIDSKTLQVTRNAYNQEQFFFRHVVKPTYNPLFVKDDTTYVFDHVNDKVALLCDTGRVIREVPIDYHLNKYWEDKVLLDDKHKRFYSMREKGGVQTFCMLSSTNFKVIRKVDITEHAYPKKVIIYNGFAYYLYKVNLDDNLNKLFRQRMI